MGTWGTGLYQDDTTCDIKEDYLDLLKVGMSKEEALKKIIEYNEDRLRYEDERDLFWMALADTQWKYGRLDEKVKKRAIEAIESGRDLEIWKKDNPKLYKKRKIVLEKLKEKLNTEQLQEKKITKMTFERPNWKVGDVILYQLLNEDFKEHRWYKKYVLLKVMGTIKSNVGSLPRNKYYNEGELVSLYNWIGDKEIDKRKIDNLKIIFLQEKTVYGPDIRLVGEYHLTKRELKKLNCKVIKNDMNNLYTEELERKYPRYYCYNIKNFDWEVIDALEREEKRGNLVKDFEE